MLRFKSSQISMEYMMIIGFVMVVVSMLLLLSAIYSREVEDSVNTNQADRIVKQIADSAESVYYFGEPSRITLEVFIPEGVESIEINTRDITFKVDTRAGVTDVFKKTSVNLQGNIENTFGMHYITIEAREGYVWINST